MKLSWKCLDSDWARKSHVGKGPRVFVFKFWTTKTVLQSRFYWEFLTISMCSHSRCEYLTCPTRSLNKQVVNSGLGTLSTVSTNWVLVAAWNAFLLVQCSIKMNHDREVFCSWNLSFSYLDREICSRHKYDIVFCSATVFRTQATRKFSKHKTLGGHLKQIEGL